MKKVFTVIITALLIVTFSVNVSFAENEVINNEVSNEVNNTTDDISNLDSQGIIDRYNANKGKIDESNTRLEIVESELSTSLKKVQELTNEVDAYSSQYEEISTKIAEVEAEIAETNTTLEEAEKEYKKKEKLLRKRLVAMYISGDTNYLDLLFSSGNLVEFLSNYYLVEQIVNWDEKILNDVMEKKTFIENKKQEQEERQIELKKEKLKADQMQTLLENSRTIEQEYINNLTDEEKALQEKIQTYKTEQAQLEEMIRNAINWSGNLAIYYTGGPMIWPVGKEGTYITSGYGVREHPIQGIVKQHSGIDIGNAGYGAPVIAAKDGVVTYAGWMGGYGNCVIINHGNGIATLYGHGQEIITELGKTVKQGEVIMLVGSTGNSTGPHLHFEVRKNGTPVSPLIYLSEDYYQTEEGQQELAARNNVNQVTSPVSNQIDSNTNDKAQTSSN